ncbi:MAG: hypothetical protein HY318_02675 [Armatimonadetes bacterium]|nr:hypothetical protein [Armatimonadota bacterium]
MALALGLGQRGAHGSSHRFWLAAQHDWVAKKGFYLSFENSSEGDAPCKLDSLRLILGISEGKNWRFVVSPSGWGLDREHQAKGVLTPTSAELWLDGKTVGKSEGGFVRDESPLMANYIPGWASGPADYLILQSSLKLTTGSQVPLNFSFAREASRPLPLLLFEPQVAKTIEWKPEENATMTIEASFRLLRYPRLQDLAPFIDRYGQSCHADWPGKVRSDEDLKKATKEEAVRLKGWGSPKGYDKFGGYAKAGWREQATGFYRVVRRKGHWWLITPQGNPCFYVGICGGPQLQWEQTPVSEREFLYEGLPPKEPPYNAAWAKNSWGINDGTEYVAIQAANAYRKYGDNWAKEAADYAVRRLKSWGFSGWGKWGGMKGLPEALVLGHGEVPEVARHPDIFDPEVRTKFKDCLRKQIEPRLKDPFVLGWSLGNEYGEIITKGEIQEILEKPDDVPAKRALKEYARDKLGGRQDTEELRKFYAGRYYEFIYRTVKEIDPNHLYLGFWIVPGWWENEEDWRLSAPYCDVIGYDRYSHVFADEQMQRLMKESDKPVLCGEYSFPAWYGGERGFGLYGTWCEDDAASGEAYKRWVESASKDPYCVGVMWFLYRDQPLTGRGPGRGPQLVHGEHYAFGVVDGCDRPKYDLVERMREANRAAVGWKLKATGR